MGKTSPTRSRAPGPTWNSPASSPSFSVVRWASVLCSSGAAASAAAGAGFCTHAGEQDEPPCHLTFWSSPLQSLRVPSSSPLQACGSPPACPGSRTLDTGAAALLLAARSPCHCSKSTTTTRGERGEACRARRHDAAAGQHAHLLLPRARKGKRNRATPIAARRTWRRASSSPAPAGLTPRKSTACWPFYRGWRGSPRVFLRLNRDHGKPQAPPARRWSLRAALSAE